MKTTKFLAGRFMAVAALAVAQKPKRENWRRCRQSAEHKPAAKIQRWTIS